MTETTETSPSAGAKPRLKSALESAECAVGAIQDGIAAAGGTPYERELIVEALKWLRDAERALREA